MRKSPASAFTLIEMLTVLAIIVLLTGLVISVGVYVHRKGALARTAGEVKLLESACENYKADTGSYPRDTEVNSVTDNLNPKVDFVPTTGTYANSSLFLYKELTGDKSGGKTKDDDTLTGDGIPDDGEPRYLKEFEPRILMRSKDKTTVLGFQDPFGFSYAYSTAAAKDEQKFRTDHLTDPSTAKRPTGSDLHGFNSGSFDLWSTGGKTMKDTTDDLTWAGWVKNW
jgi:prepilin-type N-terminal cleavage/methylation domain-containing protein